eukprot:6352799-Amphidinium_carterae.2
MALGSARVSSPLARMHDRQVTEVSCSPPLVLSALATASDSCCSWRRLSLDYLSACTSNKTANMAICCRKPQTGSVSRFTMHPTLGLTGSLLKRKAG